MPASQAARQRAATPSRASRRRRHPILEHVAEIERLAWLDTPDWGHWCENACRRVSRYLTSHRVEHRVRSTDEVPDFAWAQRHTWIELVDGTILDPTITQFWGEGHPRTRGSLSTPRTGVFPPRHPVARHYQLRGRRQARAVNGGGACSDHS